MKTRKIAFMVAGLAGSLLLRAALPGIGDAIATAIDSANSTNSPF